MSDLFASSDAVISDCGRYRYRLRRMTRQTDANTVVIMVNPSTADGTEDDQTIRKLKGFARHNGWSNLIVGNLFAYRATNVKELAQADDPVGPENDRYLRDMIGHRDTLRVIFAWGPVAKLPYRLRQRWREVARMATYDGGPRFCLGVAKDGQPRHPLMLPYGPLLPWNYP
jgi:hypothetical protein